MLAQKAHEGSFDSWLLLEDHDLKRELPVQPDKHRQHYYHHQFQTDLVEHVDRYYLRQKHAVSNESFHVVHGQVGSMAAKQVSRLIQVSYRPVIRVHKRPPKIPVREDGQTQEHQAVKK